MYVQMQVMDRYQKKIGKHAHTNIDRVEKKQSNILMEKIMQSREREREREISKSEKTKTKTNQNKTRQIIRGRRPFKLEGGEVRGKTRDMDHATSCAEKKRDDRRRGAGEKI